MKKASIILFVLISLISYSTKGQYAAFVNNGLITFERKVNTFAVREILLKENGQISEVNLQSEIQRYRSSAPQFWTDSFELFFDQTQSLYAPKSPDIENPKTFRMPVAYKNIVYRNLNGKVVTTEKHILEKIFYIKDSLKKIQWKLINEKREIAGYQCRRANGLFLDSTYVIAFYTDEIPTKSGPESFNGLPGMILGIVIPHHHITIFATDVKGINISPGKWKLPVQGKSILANNREFNIAATGMLKSLNFASSWIKLFMNL